MIVVLDLLSVAVWLPFLLLVGYLLVLGFAAPPLRLDAGSPVDTDLSEVVVLVAAHNEEVTLPRCLTSLLAEPGLRKEQVFVIANHCTDNTVSVAREHGVTVIEHNQPGRQAKGYGLAYGWQFVRGQIDAATVVIVDGDDWLAPGAISGIVAMVHHTGRPMQAVSLHLASPESRPLRRVSEFAVFIRNYIRPAGLNRLGQPVMLVAGLMAFPSHLLSLELLADDAVNEDMHLAIRLSRLGSPPVLSPASITYTYLESDESAASPQRSRWERGHIGLIRAYGLRLFIEAVRTGSRDLGMLTLELVVPPLSMLLWMMVVLSAASAVVWAISMRVLALLLAGAGWSGMFLFVLLAWLKSDRRRFPPVIFLQAVPYALGKLPLYLSTLFRAPWRIDD